MKVYIVVSENADTGDIDRIESVHLDRESAEAGKKDAANPDRWALGLAPAFEIEEHEVKA